MCVLEQAIFLDQYLAAEPYFAAAGDFAAAGGDFAAGRSRWPKSAGQTHEVRWVCQPDPRSNR